MNDIYIDDEHSDETDAWLVEAGRRLDEPAGDVARLIDAISANLGRVRRPARTLVTDSPGVLVSDRIIKQLLSIRVRALLGRLVVFVAIDGNGDTVTAVRIGLIAEYRDDLMADSEEVRDVVDDVLVSALGPRTTTTARRNITVRWQDVYTREWLV
ncbi:hypothetical protein [Gordonia insulae]|uniref:Uncharacterized protein n=1 Tax=Gordonia insulae TaxID=2420509 RepID=A0A3G8JUW7_9ACTN|nr:hypothetical protein [Gordonia insulae]AZG48713.1 hypothetical protein D7316_05334 [Gordonia insulae]